MQSLACTKQFPPKRKNQKQNKTKEKLKSPRQEGVQKGVESNIVEEETRTSEQVEMETELWAGIMQFLG